MIGKVTELKYAEIFGGNLDCLTYLFAVTLSVLSMFPFHKGSVNVLDHFIQFSHELKMQKQTGRDTVGKHHHRFEMRKQWSIATITAPARGEKCS